MERNKAGMSTPKQIRFLTSKGFVCVEKWSREDASKMLDRIAKNNWQVPFDIVPEIYIP